MVGALLAGGLALGAAPAAAGPVDPVPPPSTSSPAPPAAAPGAAAPDAAAPGAGAPGAGAPGAGAPPRYVALGDSWAAGSAAGELDPGSGTCRRSRTAYPALVARSAGEPRWLSRACASREAGSGNTQFSSLSPDVRAVTATVGADAVGLGPLLRACSTAGTVRDCDAAAARAEKAVAALPRTLDAAVAELRRGAPRAAITFLGFPLPAEGATCPAGAADAARAGRVDAVVTRLDAVLLDRVGAARMRFVDVRLGFAGHGVCAPAPWLTAWNAPDARLAGGPNAAGHAEGYRAAAANAVTTALAAPADGAAPPTTSSATPAPAGTAPLASPTTGSAPPPARPPGPADGRSGPVGPGAADPADRERALFGD